MAITRVFENRATAQSAIEASGIEVMMMTRIVFLTLGLATFAVAQPLPEPGRAPAEVMGDRPTTRPADVGPGTHPPAAQAAPPNAARPLPEAATRADAPLEEGRTSFTEAQARSRMEQAGFARISELRLEENGVWRAAAERDGRAVRIGLDYRGTVRAD